MNIRTIVFVVFAVLVSACSSGPGDSDISNIVTSALKETNPAMAMMGIQLNEIMTIDSVKILNKAKNGDDAYIVDYEATYKFTKNLGDLNPLIRGMLSTQFGNFKAGDRSKPAVAKIRVVKGSNGWVPAGG